jgi:hypothetical protein
MTLTRRQWLRAALACSLWPLAGCNRSAVGLPKDKIMQKYPMKTYAIGRFLIDIPEVAKEVSLSQAYAGMSVEWFDSTKEKFISLLKQKRMSLSGMDSGKPILAMDQSGTDDNTHFFMFRQLDPETGYSEIDAYRYSESLNGFHLFSSPVDPNRYSEALSYANMVMNAVQPRVVTPSMTERGACFDHAFVSGVETSDNEEAAIMAKFDNVIMNFFTKTLQSPVTEPSLLQRGNRASGFPGATVLRKTKREVAGLDGAEFSFKDVPDSTTPYSFQWEYDGQPKSVSAPQMAAGLDSRDSTSMSQDELLGLWDAVLESIRKRPGAV